MNGHRRGRRASTRKPTSARVLVDATTVCLNQSGTNMKERSHTARARALSSLSPPQPCTLSKKPLVLTAVVSTVVSPPPCSRYGPVPHTVPASQEATLGAICTELCAYFDCLHGKKPCSSHIDQHYENDVWSPRGHSHAPRRPATGSAPCAHTCMHMHMSMLHVHVCTCTCTCPCYMCMYMCMCGVQASR